MKAWVAQALAADADSPAAAGSRARTVQDGDHANLATAVASVRRAAHALTNQAYSSAVAVSGTTHVARQAWKRGARWQHGGLQAALAPQACPAGVAGAARDIVAGSPVGAVKSAGFEQARDGDFAGAAKPARVTVASVVGSAHSPGAAVDRT